MDYLEDYAAMDSFQESDSEEYDLSLLMSLLKALPDDKRELFGLGRMLTMAAALFRCSVSGGSSRS